MKKLLVVVDMQNDFIGGPLGTREAEAVVPAVAARIKRAKADGDEILFTRDTHGDDYPASAEGKNFPSRTAYVARTAGRSTGGSIRRARKF